MKDKLKEAFEKGDKELHPRDYEPRGKLSIKVPLVESEEYAELRISERFTSFLQGCNYVHKERIEEINKIMSKKEEPK